MVARTRTADLADEIDGAELDFESEIQAEFGGGVDYRVEVSRITAGAGQAGAYLFAVGPEELATLKDHVRDEWGTGTYLVRVKKNNRYMKQFRFSVEAPPRRPAAAAAPAPVSDGGLVAVFDKLLTRFDENQKRLIEAIEKRAAAAPAADPFVMFDRVLGMMQKINPPAAATVDPGKAFELVRQGIELGKDVAGGGDGTGLMDIIKTAIEQLAPAINAVAQRGAGVAAAQPGAAMADSDAGAGAATAQLPPPSAAPPPADRAADLATQLDQIIKYLTGRAALNADPALYAEWLSDNLMDHPELTATLLQVPNILDQLSHQFPAITTYRQWFDLLLEEFKKLAHDMVEPVEGDQDATERPAHAAGADPGR